MQTPAIDESAIDESTAGTEPPAMDESYAATQAPAINAFTAATLAPAIHESTAAMPSPAIDEFTAATEAPTMDDLSAATLSPAINESTGAMQAPAIHESTAATVAPTNAATLSPAIDESTAAMNAPATDESTAATEAPTIDESTAATLSPAINESTAAMQATLTDAHEIIYNDLDVAASNLCMNWKGKVHLDCIPISNSFLFHTIPFLTASSIDVCSYFGFDGENNASHLFINPKRFPPPNIGSSDSMKDCVEWIEVKNYIERAFLEGGSPVVSNGGGKTCRLFFCKHGVRKHGCKKPSSGIVNPPSYRHDSLINCDKGGRRQNGRSLPRRTRTSRPSSNDTLCPFRFRVQWNEYGFFINLNQGSGCAMHNFHYKVDSLHIPFPTRLIPQSEKDTLAEMAEACAWSGVGRNYLSSKLGRHIAKSKIAYLQNQEPPLSLAKGSSTNSSSNSDVDSLLDFLDSTKEISRQVLWDVPTDGNETRLVSETKNTSGKSVQDLSSSPDMDLAKSMVSEARIEQNVPAESKVFLSVAWANQHDLRFFKLFSEVIHVDITCDSNRTKNHLLTFSLRTSTMKQVIFLKIWLPNQRRVSFRWVFKCVLPSLFPLKFFLRVRLVMVDGDPQQAGELGLALLSYMPNATRASCGWHIIEQGWKRKGPKMGDLPTNKAEKFKAFVRHVKYWCYSLMRPGFIEDKDEYSVSLILLFGYIRSPSALDSCDGKVSIITEIVKFIRSYVIIYDDSFLFFKRKHVRHFNTSTNSAHEGTNYGMKSHGASVKPCSTMTKSARSLSLQSNMKGMQIEEEGMLNISTRSLWSNRPTADHITTAANSILHQLYELKDKYKSRRTGQFTWELCFVSSEVNNMSETDLEKRPGSIIANSPIPRFKRIRRVTVCKDGSAICSCYHYERTGLGCQHIMHVFSKEFPEWNGFTHHDVDIRWWNLYLHYGYKPGWAEIGVRLNSAVDLGLRGPKWPGPVPEPCGVYDEQFETQPAVERVKNYTLAEIEAMPPVPPAERMVEGAKHTVHNEDGFTQESVVLEDEYEVEANELSQQADAFGKSVSDVGAVNSNASCRNHFSALFDELTTVLDTLHSHDQNKITESVISSKISRLRGCISKKRKKVSGQTYSINAEEGNSCVRRRFASKNM